ncbi:MAG: exopolysaccharide biosynthesis polyprenyl glycosylphosphotransferase [Actinomycetota bacterium]
MALSPALRTALWWRAIAPPRRAPLVAIIPGIDAIALLGAANFMRHLDHYLGITYVVLTFLVLMCSGSHRARINPRLGDDFAWLFASLTVPIVFVAHLAPSDAMLAHFVKMAPVAVGFVLLGRAVSYLMIREARMRGYVNEPTLIVGAGQLGVQVAKTLQEHPEFGLVPIGFLDSFEELGLPAPILGDVRELEAVVKEFNIERVIVAFGATREPEMVPIIRACDRLPVEVHVMPRFFELGVAKEGPFTDDLWGIPLIRLRRSALRTVAWRTKRVFDLVVGSLALVLSAPMFVAAAVAVRLSSPGPVFFRQTRIGQRGEVFELLKFRTLRVNDDSDTTWSVANDDRLTRVGGLLRRTSIDELPQLINVLRGEMSLVGPRPERPYFVDQFRVAVAGYEDRHRVPAGITGWAQVHGLRGDTSIEKRAVFDNHYVENWSLWRDIVILIRTIGTVASGAGR